MFDKFKNRRLQKATPEDTSSKVVSLEAASTDSSSFEQKQTAPPIPVDIFSPEHLLQYLESKEEDFPEDLRTIRIYLNKVIAKVKNRVDTNLILEEMKANGNATEEENSSPESETKTAYADAAAELILPSNHMIAFLYILPPVGSGKQLNEEMILEALKEKEVTFGLDMELLTDIVSKQSYAVIYPIARGREAIHGKGGELVEHFSRTQKINLVEDEKGSIDYKSLNIFQNITAGESICDIIPPTEGQDGCNIFGKILKTVNGKPVSVPKGKNTSINADNSALVADVDGNILFSGGAFCVNPQLVISQNVDGSTGNLDFSGDILVKGDVQKGFTVKAGGNILVQGMAESATIKAGGDIDIKKGMNGGGDGTLEAGGSIRAHFLEQTIVNAGGDVLAQAIINCQIISGGSILALDGMGSIIAGSLTAHRSVEAKKIGNLSNIKTIIKIGYSNRETDDEEYLTKELKNGQDTLEKLNKNVQFLEGLPTIPAEKEELYQKLKEQQDIYQNMVLKTSSQLTELSAKKFDYTKCRVRGDIVYGITTVSLGFSRLIISDTTNKCNVYVDEDILRLGTF